jgi:hypothetical protein
MRHVRLLVRASAVLLGAAALLYALSYATADRAVLGAARPPTPAVVAAAVVEVSLTSCHATSDPDGRIEVGGWAENRQDEDAAVAITVGVVDDQGRERARTRAALDVAAGDRVAWTATTGATGSAPVGLRCELFGSSSTRSPGRAP